jgi:DUF1365 family protein
MSSLRLFEGHIVHHRKSPVKHSLGYPMIQVWLNVAKLSEVDEVSRWWSSSRFNLVQFRRSDYLPGNEDLYNQVKSLIRERCNRDFHGEVYLLANLRYWGVCYNPACFYCCYEDGQLVYFLCEVHNTPWGERFTYIHKLNKTLVKSPHLTDQLLADSGRQTCRFKKSLHVSPFMPMELDYQWNYQVNDDKFVISMHLHDQEKTVFSSTLKLDGRPLNQREASLIPFRYPLLCIKVILRIYWNALVIWLKGVPFLTHPNT